MTVRDDGGGRGGVALDEEVLGPEENADKVREGVARLVEQAGVGEHVHLQSALRSSVAFRRSVSFIVGD